MNIAMLGSGFIARFYADSLQAQRAKDKLISVYSRNIEKAQKFADDYRLGFFSDSMDEVVSRADVDVVVISLPNNLHEAAVASCVKFKKHVLCTKPLGRLQEYSKALLDFGLANELAEALGAQRIFVAVLVGEVGGYGAVGHGLPASQSF